MIDMHVHILPGVDDGARSEEMTREMLHRAADAGITYMVCTPHVYRPADQQRNCGAFGATRQLAHDAGVRVALGCELNYRALVKLDVQALDGFSLGHTRCVLLEFGNDQPPPDWEFMLSDMADHDWLPIIAHPERYRYIQKDIALAQAMCALGCELQVDAGGLLAPLLSAERRTARRLLKEGLVSYVASDAHRPQDYDVFARAYRAFHGEWPRANRLTDTLRRRRRENG